MMAGIRRRSLAGYARRLTAEVSRPESLGRSLWQEEGDLGNEMKLGIQLQEVRLGDADAFVSRQQWAADPLLAQTSIIRFRQGSVFRLTDQEARAAFALWNGETSLSAESAPTNEHTQRSAYDRLLTVFDDGGKPLRATCRIHGSGQEWCVIVESRGGTLGAPSETNADYATGFSLILARLAALDAVVTDALVNSKKLIDAGLAEAERRLHPEGFPFPIRLNASNDQEVAKALRRAQPNIGSDRQNGAGNSTRRVLLKAELQRLPSGVSVEDFLTGTKALGLITDTDLLAFAASDPFEPTSIVDERTKVMASIVRRQGSPRFRRLLLEAYGGRCAVTGCDAEPALEAAHIIAYLGPRTNSIQNGILRADLHTLFDRGLVGFDAETHKVVVHPLLASTAYGTLADKPMHLPGRIDHWPNASALRQHLAACGLSSSLNSLHGG